MYEIKSNFTPQEMESILKLRYEVYAQEIYTQEKGYSLSYGVCHKEKMLRNPLDQSGTIFAAFKDGEAIGTLLLNDSRDPDFGDHVKLYGLDEVLSRHDEAFSLATMLIVKKQFRSTYVPFSLGVKAYKKSLWNGAKYNFIGCETYMVDFFLRIGYEFYGSNFHHPEYGKLIVMKIELDNEEKLRELRSPILKYLLQYKAEQKKLLAVSETYSTIR